MARLRRCTASASEIRRLFVPAEVVLAVSAHTGQGMDALKAAAI